MAEKEFKPVLTLWNATMVVAGSMIGSGIFIVSANISMHVGSAGWLIAVWLLTGFMTITAAVSYGELSGMFPKAGGQYTYLKEAYNPLIAFLYGWSFFAVIQTGTIAAVGVAFSKFTAYLIPSVSENIVWFDLGFFQISPAQILAIATILLLTYINTRGVESGNFIQSTLTAVKLISLFGLIVAGFFAFKPEVWSANWADAWSMKKLLPDGNIETYLTIGAFGAIASAMVGSIFSSDAWNNVTFIAGEIKNPQRNIGLSLFLGTLLVTVIYVSANIMYTGILPMAEIAFAENDRVGVAASTVIFGAAGTLVIAVMIMISTFGCNNGLILSGARVYYTMAKDKLFFKQAGQLNEAAVPQKALWMQGALASVWCLSGRYGDLLDMISFVVVLFYMLTIAGIFILRKKQPTTPRPYKAFGYPVLPLLYMI
ncbi:MAG: amino acid permease, partial [Cyclobacteriaceae bacterium]|nr:amino acid permease [Cyclobacteriaceae bacterium]